MSLVAKPPTQELTDLVGALHGRWSGRTAMCRCPAHADATPSLSLRQGDHGILVHCFAGCEPEVVLRELSRLSPSTEHKVPAWNSTGGDAHADRLWREAEPVSGSRAETYLRARDLPTTLPDLRYHPRCPQGRRPHTRFLPSLLVAIRDGVHLQALQRIFLDGVPGTYTSKLMIGSPGRGCWQGSRPREELALAEGFETAAAFEQLHGIPCWSTLGGERLDRVSVPPGVRRLVIAEDNDAQGRRFAAKAVAAHEERGLKVCRAAPPALYNDWADALRARERGGGSKG